MGSVSGCIGRRPVREEEDAYDAAAQEHRLRPLVSLRSGESSISRPIPHRDWWPGHPHWVFNDATLTFGIILLGIRSVVACGSVCSFHLLAWLWLPTLTKAKALHGLLPPQVASALFCFSRFGIRLLAL